MTNNKSFYSYYLGSWIVFSISTILYLLHHLMGPIPYQNINEYDLAFLFIHYLKNYSFYSLIRQIIFGLVAILFPLSIASILSLIHSVLYVYIFKKIPFRQISKFSHTHLFDMIPVAYN
ncbi:MAG: hypothetical protein HeimC3_21710 [Candidatus Heimdallarchaeota archaeon LC_3]|nr:MAG: hypothetical protein HeimC3_21710 [Candidatus Heimdallarchaeota archaeon LC_3]